MKRQTLTGWMLVPPAFIGLVDSAYIAINSLQGFIVPCGWAGGCDQVLNSPYARVSGVSIAGSFDSLLWPALSHSHLPSTYFICRLSSLKPSVIIACFLHFWSH
jgi:hypothetical protein